MVAPLGHSSSFGVERMSKGLSDVVNIQYMGKRTAKQAMMMRA
jgi:hypothetical protein